MAPIRKPIDISAIIRRLRDLPPVERYREVRVINGGMYADALAQIPDNHDVIFHLKGVRHESMVFLSPTIRSGKLMNIVINRQLNLPKGHAINPPETTITGSIVNHDGYGETSLEHFDVENGAVIHRGNIIAKKPTPA